MFPSFNRPIVLITQSKSHLSRIFGRYSRKPIAISVTAAILSAPTFSYSENLNQENTASDAKSALIVVSSIKPIQLLVETIAGDLTKQGVIQNQLLLPAGTSPHDYAMRFSDTKKLQYADIVFWVGENLETFLSKPLKLNKKGETISFNKELNNSDTHHIQKHKAKITQNNNHKHHHKSHDGALQEIHKEPHPWLSPFNALQMAEVISVNLSRLLPSYSVVFSENLHHFTKKMINLELSYRQSYSTNLDNEFIVYHDAYKELINHFKLNQLAVITPMAGRNPKLRHVLNLRKLVEQNKVTCIITEPNANTKILSRIISASENNNIKQFNIDPIASNQTVTQTGFYDYFSSVLEKIDNCIK